VKIQPFDCYVFRETKRRTPARGLVEDIAADVRTGRTEDAIVRAGEIETALADAGDPGARAAERLTDALAAELVGAKAPVSASLDELRRSLEGAGHLELRRPEGFSYHALHPLDFADAVARPPLDRVARAAVVGVRSIGTTLAGVVCAAIHARGGASSRRSVRPEGSPYDRVTRLTDQEERWVRREVAAEAELVVVDEGPGLSGSSLLSVVDALVAAGAPRGRIVVMCTRAVDPATLRARDAVSRWSGLRIATVTAAPRFPARSIALGPGEWRRELASPDVRAWPGCWSWFERAKALSVERRAVFKFEGLGRYGAEVSSRAHALADAGFGPPVRRERHGLLAYALHGNSQRAAHLDATMIERLADYAAWRAVAFEAEPSSADVECMVQKNAAVLFGLDVRLPLGVERPCTPDARLMPYEWRRDAAGVSLKTDAASHGDDQLFPGPTDIAWDLAGAIIEWRMPGAAIDSFLERYVDRSGDRRVRARLPAWLFAYASFRLAWLVLAEACVDPVVERGCLAREARSLRRWMRPAARLGLLGTAGEALERRWRGEPSLPSPGVLTI
jgi:hypothetical protein